MNFKTAFREANAAFVEDMYEEALDLYNTALMLENNSDAFAKRAQCNIKLRKYKEAAIDANTAIQIDGRNARGHLRRGVALFYLNDYENSQKAFEVGLSVATKDRETFETWIKRCKATRPTPPAPKQPAQPASSSSSSSSSNPPPPATAPAPKQPASTPSPPAPASVPMKDAPVPQVASGASKIRREWYQNDSFVTVTIFAKNVAPGNAKIDIQEQNLSVNIKLTEGNDYVVDLDLFGKVEVAKCSHEITPTKVEIKLKKAEPVKWQTLESEEEVVPQAPITNAKKNWDAIAKEEGKEEDKSEMGFLRDLWSGASEEEQRAMRKSMEQSGGTVLNMNWGQVEEKKIKPKPSAWSANQPVKEEGESDSDDDEHWGRRRQEEEERERARRKPRRN